MYATHRGLLKHSLLNDIWYHLVTTGYFILENLRSFTLPDFLVIGDSNNYLSNRRYYNQTFEGTASDNIDILLSSLHIITVETVGRFEIFVSSSCFPNSFLQ